MTSPSSIYPSMIILCVTHIIWSMVVNVGQWCVAAADTSSPYTISLLCTSIILIIYLLACLFLHLSHQNYSNFHPSSINRSYISSFPLPTPQCPCDTYPAISYILYLTLLYFLLYYIMAASYSTIFPLSFPYSTISLYDNFKVHSGLSAEDF
jgi:hypothetical protein